MVLLDLLDLKANEANPAQALHSLDLRVFMDLEERKVVPVVNAVKAIPA